MLKVLFVVLIQISLISGLMAQSEDLTIQAEMELQPVITALFEAFSDDVTLNFVETDAHIVATTNPDADVLATVFFLPDTALSLQIDELLAREFMAFAVSPDGQQVLIDAGLLPEVVTITDQTGVTIEIPQPVRTAVSPYSLATYMVYTTGAADRLLAAGYLGARDPRGAAAMERIDPRFPELSAADMNQNNTNVEEIARLAPDVILSSAREDWLDAVAELGIPIVHYEGESPEALKAGLQLTGQLFGPDAAYRAQIWIDYYDAVLTEVESSASENEQRPMVLFTGTEPTRVISGEMYQTSLIEAAGGASVTRDLTGFWNDVNLEQIAVWNPDMILVPPYGGASVEAITENADWQFLDAVQNNAVYRVPKLVAPWDTPTPDSVLGIIWMAQRFYPDSLSLDCSEETRYFYNTFYDYPIAEEEVADLCGQS